MSSTNPMVCPAHGAPLVCVWFGQDSTEWYCPICRSSTITVARSRVDDTDALRAEVSRLTAEVAALKAGGYRRGVEDAARVCDGMYFGLANGDVVARETARAAYTATAAKIRALLAVEAEAGEGECEPGTSSKSTFRTCEPETGEEER